MSDPNDTARKGGPEAVRAEYDNVVALGSLKGFIFQGSGAISPPPMLIKDLLPLEGLAFIGGQSGAGKTFVGVDCALSLATGTDFFGRSVKERCGVVIIAAEGRGMIAARIEAARRHRAPHLETLPLAWAAEIPELMADADIKKYGAQLACVGKEFEKKYHLRLGAVIIDTVVSTFDLDDEDHNSEAARTIRKMRALGKACGALIVPVHHYGKTVATGLRGGSSWRAGADVVISVLADRDDTTGDVKNRRLAVAKARDGIEGPIAPFTLPWVRLGIDDDGEPFGSCVVEPVLGRSPIPERMASTTKVNRAVRTFREAFAEAVDASGAEIVVMGNGPRVRAARVQDVRTQFDRRYATGETETGQRSEAARKAFKRALESLAAQFATETQNGVEWIWAIER
jgi:hypothetical protein